MKKICLILAALAVTAGAAAADFDAGLSDSTLRLDYVLGQMPGGQPVALLDHSRVTPGWHGRRHRLAEVPLRGNGRVTVTDSLTGDTLYATSFNTLFQEWLVSPEAARQARAFQHTALVPLPQRPAVVTLQLLDPRGRILVSSSEVYNPADILVQRPDTVYTPPYRLLHGDLTDPARIDVAIVGEGYATPAETDTFYLQAERAVNSILSYEPFRSRQDAFNFFAVEAPSADSGVSTPKYRDWRRTPFDSHFSTFYADRYLTTAHVWKIHDALEGVPYEHIIVLENTPEYGGGGIYNSYTLTAAGNEWFEPVVAHEFGHSFGGLADEYFYDHPDIATDSYPADVEPWEQNITTLVDFDSKWRDMLPPKTKIPTPVPANSSDQRPQTPVGVYEGGGYVSEGVYRPVDYCRMRSTKSEQPFCPVCQRDISRVIDFYRGQQDW